MKIAGGGNNRIQIATPNDVLLNVETDLENNENDPIVSDQYMEIPITQKRGLHDTGVRNVHNVHQYTIGNGALKDLPKLLEVQRCTGESIVFFVDEFFSRDWKREWEAEFKELAMQ